MTTPSNSQTTRGQEWAALIRNGSRAGSVRRVISAINRETRARQATRADVIVACAQILGQSIAPGGPEIAAEMREGIMSMIDGYAMEVATHVE